jgi:hypothetical protein
MSEERKKRGSEREEENNKGETKTRQPTTRE